MSQRDPLAPEQALTQASALPRNILIALMVALMLPLAGLAWDLHIRESADELAATRERLEALRERLTDPLAAGHGALGMAEEVSGRHLLRDQLQALTRQQQWCGTLDEDQLRQALERSPRSAVDTFLGIAHAAERRVRMAADHSRTWLLLSVAAALLPVGYAITQLIRLRIFLADVEVAASTSSTASSSAATSSFTRSVPRQAMSGTSASATARLLGADASPSLTPATQLAAILPRFSDPLPTLPPTPINRLRGRVLVVEDNPINQRVTNRQLLELGLDVVVVDSGEAALLHLASDRWDAVLMDLQLPGIDGLTATSRWRTQEGAEGRRRIPVVAITANSSGSDREACFAAGMDGYVAKPARLDDLHKALQRWLVSRPVTVSTHVASTGVSAAALAEQLMDPLHDSALWKRLRLETAATDPLMLEELMRELRNQAPDQVAILISAMDNRDLEAVRGAAHRLKGSAGMLGLPRLATAAKDLELAAKAGETATCVTRLVAVQTALLDTFADPAVVALG